MSQEKAGGKLRDIAINLLLVFLSVALPLAAFELYLAWDNRRPHVPVNTVDVGGESFRFVARPEAVADAAGKLLILGDSFTVGAACGLDGSYPSELARRLERDGDPRGVLNLGISGADPLVYLHLVERLLALDRVPSTVVVTLYSNDIEIGCSACRYLDRLRRDPAFAAPEIARLEALCASCAKAKDAPAALHGGPRRIHTWLQNKSYAYGLFRDALVGLSMKAGFNTGWGRTAYPPLWRDHAGTEYKLLKFALAGIRDTLAARGVTRVLVAIYPDVENLRAENPYVALYRDVEADLSRELGLPVWSGYPAFLDAPASRRNLSFSLVDHHPNREAHARFAAGVHGALRRAGFAGPGAAPPR